MTQATFVSLGNHECLDERGSPLELIDHYQTLAGKCLNQTDFDNPGSYILESYIIHIEAGFMRSKHDQVRCYALIGVIIRVALRLGLHRDSTKRQGRISVFSKLCLVLCCDHMTKGFPQSFLRVCNRGTNSMVM